jgi:hypothetical protein
VVDWETVRLKPGDWSCPEHGVVSDPWQQIVPACRDCGRSLTQAYLDREGKLQHREPTPKTCAGPDRHPFGPGKVLLNSRACGCSASGLHRAWTCTECGDSQEWPRHDVGSAAPFFGPGSR